MLIQSLFRGAGFCLFAMLLSLACLLSSGGRAEAAQSLHTLNYFQTSEVTVDGRKALRVEIGMSGSEPLSYDVAARPTLRQQLIVRVQKARRGEVKSDIPLAEDFAKRVQIKEGGNDSLKLVFDFANPVVDGSYAIHEEKAERRSHKPHRLVIDIFVPEQAHALTVGGGVTGHTIVLDPGHGGSDTGAVGPSGVTEASVTLAVAQKVRAILEAGGANVVMTRQTDVDVYGPNASAGDELQARVDVGAQAPGAEIFVSIHCNAFSNPGAHGTEAYYYAPSGEASARLAACLNEEIAAATGLFNRGVKPANFYVMKHSAIPSSLVELAFVTNYEEESLLASDSFQATLAEAIVRAIGRYFS